jgi:hypothetical protein
MFEKQKKWSMVILCHVPILIIKIKGVPKKIYHSILIFIRFYFVVDNILYHPEIIAPVVKGFFHKFMF